MNNSPIKPAIKKTLPRSLWVVTAIVLIVAAFPLPYGYYTFARIVTCLTFGVLAYSAQTSSLRVMFWKGIFAPLAVLFNPLIPIHLTKEIWMVLDIVAATVIITHFVTVRGIRA